MRTALRGFLIAAKRNKFFSIIILEHEAGQMPLVLIVHGEKHHKDGRIHDEFLRRVQKAIDIAEDAKISHILISGGRTRRKFRSEAESIKALVGTQISIPLLLECDARSTSENAQFSRILLKAKGISFERIYVVTSALRIPRSVLYYKRYWGEDFSKITFLGVPDNYPVLYIFIELLYVICAWLDFHEKHIIRLAKKLFRNA